MSGDRTVLKKGAPRFPIDGTAYVRISATKGYVEGIHIFGVDFDVAKNEYIYTWSRDLSPTFKNQPAPIKIYESELVDLCEALNIQISVLKRELDKLLEQQTTFCPVPIKTVQPRTPTIVENTTKPPPPRFGANEVVYLLETAQVVGRLEAFRLSGMTWNTKINQWLYRVHIRSRPGRGMTVGDRDNWNRVYDVYYPETSFGTLCEALPLAVAYMTLAVNRAQFRISALCPPGSGSS